MNYSLKLLLCLSAILIFSGCESDVDPADYERPSTATSANPLVTPGDSPASDELEEDAYEEVIPENADVLTDDGESRETPRTDESPTDESLTDESPSADEAAGDEEVDIPSPEAENDSPDATTEEPLEDQTSIEGEGSENATGDTASIRDNVPRMAPSSTEASEDAEESDDSATEPVANVVPETVELDKREIQLLVEDKSFKTVGKPKALQVSYDDIDLLKVLNMEPVPLNAVDYFPEWLNELDGQRIRIRGFMYPPFQETDIEKFLLARDNDICCFGRDPKIYDIIRVKMKEGTTTDYIPNRPFDVVGVFHIKPEPLDDESLLKLYEIDDAMIINK